MQDIQETTTTKFSIHWRQPDGGVGGYRVWVDNSGSYTPLPLDQRYYTVIGRQAATQYTVQVATVIESGYLESDRRSLNVTTSM